jgi:hypothetical protein
MITVTNHLGRVGMAVQVLLLAVAFTGMAMAAVQRSTQTREPARASVF